jgi:hypothetical protein
LQNPAQLDETIAKKQNSLQNRPWLNKSFLDNGILVKADQQDPMQ